MLFSGYLTIQEKIDEDSYILEFKSTDNVNKLEEISKNTLKQIEDGKYSSTLKQTDTKEILYLGIAFCGKQTNSLCSNKSDFVRLISFNF